MRGSYERDPIEIASEDLRSAARQYAGAYLQSPFSQAADDAASKLRQASVAYAFATGITKSLTPRKKRAAPTKGKDK